MSPRVLDIEKQQERENLILDCALELIKKDGAALLTIDKVVSHTPYSKGTIYNHFSGKEDLLLSLCIRNMNDLAELFNRAQTLDGNLREKALATMFAYMLYARLNPVEFMLVITAKSSSITDKSSELHCEQQVQSEGKIIGPTAMLFQQALDAGEINPPIPMSVEQITFACWSQGFGCNALLLQDVERCGARTGLFVEQEMLNSVQLLLDGLRFKPLSYEFDWSKTLQQLKDVIFKDEVQTLADRGQVLQI